jgi:hypothetical protein
MGSGEKKVAVGLVVVLAALVAVYVLKPNLGAPKSESPMGPGGRMGPAMAQSGGGPGAAGADASCSTGQAGASAKTQEFGKPGAKVEIVAVIPVAHGCHKTSEGELKKAYQAHPNDIHLTIVDLQGPDAAKYKSKVGVNWTAIAINGKTDFSVNGKQVQLQRAEGQSYQPSDLVPIIEEQLKKSA